MSVSDVVSAAGNTGFAQAGFVISFVVFTLIVVWALLRPKAAMHAAARSVFDDGDRGSPQPRKEPSDGRQ